MRHSIALALIVCVSGAPAFAQEEAATSAAEATPEKKRDRSWIGAILFYLPNRVFDLTDIVRARVRLALGVAVQARATKLVSANVGSYGGLYAGLHGPRGKRRIPWPAGFEGYTGISASVAKVGTDGPYYGPTEVGAGFQVLVFGVDLGVAPLEVLDFIVGFIGVDLRNDDI